MILLLKFPRWIKRLIALVIDLIVCSICVYLAFALRLEDWDFTNYHTQGFITALVLAWAIAVPIFVVFGLYRAIFRYAGLAALMAVVRAVGVFSIVYAAIFTVAGVNGVPRSVGIILPILLLLCAGAVRILARFFLGGFYQSKQHKQGLPRVLIYGAGSAGRQIAAALLHSREMLAVGFIDDDARLHNNTINGLRVFATNDLRLVINSQSITDVLLAIPSASRTKRNEILQSLQPYGLHVRSLPGLMDLAAGRVSLSDVAELDIDDLLGRDVVSPNKTLLAKNIHDKVVLVTGAGGSIGSELCRQILTQKPKTLLLFDNSEYALYTIHQELEFFIDNKFDDLAQVDNEVKTDNLPNVIPLLGSVYDENRINEIMKAWSPDTVYHAAAYKHVPLVEHNPTEGVNNNVFGTLCIAKACIKYQVANLVLISTDKAVRPTNVMGASKRLAEMILQALAKENSETIFSMVRFGNVLGSSGSVVPLFRRQINDGGPITLTHAEITRYFMSIPEAAQLVIQAGSMGTGGDVFVLDMGEPVKIIDLAKRMVVLSGLTLRDDTTPNGDIEIKITGLRPGEKLFEELLIGDNPQSTVHPKIMRASEQYLDFETLTIHLDKLKNSIENNNVLELKNVLSVIVDGYKSSTEIVDYVYLNNK